MRTYRDGCMGCIRRVLEFDARFTLAWAPGNLQEVSAWPTAAGVNRRMRLPGRSRACRKKDHGEPPFSVLRAGASSVERSRRANSGSTLANWARVCSRPSRLRSASRRQMAARDKPARSASCRWVSPAARRARRSTLPKVVIVFSGRMGGITRPLRHSGIGYRALFAFTVDARAKLERCH